MTQTATKRYDELVPGDRIVLPGGLVRTFSHAAPNGYLNRRNLPLWNVYYAEGRTPGVWSGGNSGLPSSTCTVIVEGA